MPNLLSETETFTLGVEEEFQIIDPVTRELSPHNTEIIEMGLPILGDKIKPLSIGESLNF